MGKLSMATGTKDTLVGVSTRGISGKKNNMEKKWQTYQQLLIKEHGVVKLKPYEEIKDYCNSWLQYYQIVHLFNEDKKNRF